MRLHLDKWWENGLVFKILWRKIHRNFLASKYDIKQHSDATYSEIRCIALCVLQTSKVFWVFLFRNHLSEPLGKQCLLAPAQKVMICDAWFVDFDPFCLFRVSRFVALWSSCFGQKSTSYVCFADFSDLFLFLSLAKIKQPLPSSFDKKSTHHRDFLRYFWAV